jgi:hypothetical protein
VYDETMENIQNNQGRDNVGKLLCCFVFKEDKSGKRPRR